MVRVNFRRISTSILDNSGAAGQRKNYHQSKFLNPEFTGDQELDEAQIICYQIMGTMIGINQIRR